MPVIGPGAGFMLTVVVVLQPVGSVKVMVAEPPLTPVTTPLLLPIVAIPMPPLTHTPLPLSVSVSVWPGHMPALTIPPMAAGKGFTVTVAVR